MRKHALTALLFFLLRLVPITESFPLSTLLSVEWIQCSCKNFNCWSIGFRPDLFFKFWASDFGLAISLSRLCRWPFICHLSVLNFWDLGSQLSFSISQTSNTSKTICTFLRQLWTVYFPTKWNVPETLSLHRLARTRISFTLIHFVRTTCGIYNILHLKNLNSSENNPKSVQILLLRRQLRRLLSNLSQRSFWEIYCVATIAVWTCTNHSASHRWEATAICKCRSWWWSAAEPFRQ